MYNPEKSSWFNPDIEYLFNSEIIEYDMQSAGLSLIKKHSLLPPSEIQRLIDLGKKEATVAVGILQRDLPGFSKKLLDKFTLAREEFIKANDLNDSRILTVKKDAIFTVGSCPVVDFGELTFQRKSTFSSYIRFVDNSNIEVFFSGKDLEIKGIGEIGLSRHRLYLLVFLKKVIGMIEDKNPSIRRYLRTFVDDYKADNLDEGYYLQFNNLSSSLDKMFNYKHVVLPLVQVTIKEMGE
jgi:hypothetical protein